MKFLNVFAGNRRKVPNFGSEMPENAKIPLKKRIFMNIGCLALATALFQAPNWLIFVSVALESHFRYYFGNFKNQPKVAKFDTSAFFKSIGINCLQIIQKVLQQIRFFGLAWPFVLKIGFLARFSAQYQRVIVHGNPQEDLEVRYIEGFLMESDRGCSPECKTMSAIERQAEHFLL